MRKRTGLFFLIFCLLLTACAPAAQPEPAPDPPPAHEASAPEETPTPPAPEEPPEPELSQREKDWIEDIEFLREQYKEKHASPFYLHTEEEFDRKLDDLSAKVGKLTDNDIFFELTAIVAGMGDIHTNVWVPEILYERLLPFDAGYFGEHLYLCNYRGGCDELAPYLWREIVAINGVDVTYLRRKAESIISPVNTWLSKELFPFLWVPVAAFYDWATGLGERETYTLQLLNENQEVESVEVPVISWEEYEGSEVVRPESYKSVQAIYNGDWTEYVDRSGGCIYLAVGTMDNTEEPHYKELFEEVAGLQEEHPDCRKLAIDLRRNSGGYGLARRYLENHLHILKELPFEQVFVLTGGYTTSNAMRCLTLFQEELGAVTVGEPTGQFMSFFLYSTSAEPVTITLPHSQLSVAVSTGWGEGDNPESTVYNKKNVNRLYEWENTIMPDVYVHMDVEDVREGRDTVVEWVLAQ